MCATFINKALTQVTLKSESQTVLQKCKLNDNKITFLGPQTHQNDWNPTTQDLVATSIWHSNSYPKLSS